MKAVTLRNIPKELARVIRRKAQRDGRSINKTVLDILEAAAGLQKDRRRDNLNHDLDSLAGSWSKEEAAAFDSTSADHRVIDEKLWK